jgi:localization factor PodJL
MLPSDHDKSEPAAMPQAAGEVPASTAAAGLQEALQRITSQLSDADRRHGTALEDMRERLGQFGRQVDEVRAGLPAQLAGGLTRVEAEIAALSERIAAFGRERRSQKDGEAPTPGQAGPDEPWDAQSAEALTRAYESAEAHPPVVDRRQRRSPKPTIEDRLAKAAAGRQAPAYDRAWLEARFAGIASLLQQSLAESSPAKPLAALDKRLDLLEERLEALLQNAGASTGGNEALARVEEHIKELSSQFEATRRQLDRLDAIDAQLHQLSLDLEHQRERPPMPPPTRRDEDMEALIDTAAERAASRLAAAGAAPAAEETRRIEALERLIQDYIAERRRGEETTSGMFHTIEDALVRIVDRVEAMETAPPPAAELPAARAEEGIDAEGERLAEAYAAGARILGQEPAPEPVLDAASYAPASRESEADEAMVSISPSKPSAEENKIRQELRASAMRAKLKAQGLLEGIVPAAAPAGPDTAPPAIQPLAEVVAGGAKVIRSKATTMVGGRRSSLLLGSAMVAMFGAGFVTVDRFVLPTPSAPLEAVGPDAGVRPGDVGWSRKSSSEATDAAAAGSRPNPSGQQEATSDAPSRARGEEQAPPQRIGTPEAPITQVSVMPSTVPGMFVEPGRLTGVPAASSVDPSGPDAIAAVALRAAAVKGDAAAQLELASRLAEGKGVQQDYKQAIAWYERAAMRGLPAAQFRLGAHYERGLGVAVDEERAKVWYRRAAEQGHLRAMHNLGVLIVGKDGDVADYAAAVPWFRLAADRGFTDSQFNLGVLHTVGRGVEKDLTEAYKWFGLAARAGDGGAARRLEDLEAQLDVTEREAAEKKLATWRAADSSPAGEVSPAKQ